MTWYDPPFIDPKKRLPSVTDSDHNDDDASCDPKSWLETLPSKSGTVLAAILANIMTEGLTPNQENILGNFISSVGSLISYKASRDELC
jgi:hypothetical protein